jgi:integrase
MAKRRGHGEGAIYQRQDGTWCAIFDLGYVTGKRRRRWLYGKTRKEVAEKLREAQREHDQGVDLTADRTTVAKYLEHWLDTAVKQRNKERTQISSADTVRRHITPAIGRHRLDKLRPEHVQAMVASIQVNGHDRTAQYARAIVVRALNQAVRWRLISYNVAAVTEAPHVEPRTSEPLSLEQARALLDAVRGDPYEALYRIALSLGLRRGEILGLRWVDVDLERRELRISGALQRIAGKLVRTTPKTKTSVRTLSLPETVYQSLRDHLRRQVAAFPDAEYVFVSRSGTPIDPRNLLRRFKDVLGRAGLPTTIRFHDLRHSCATFLIAQGEHPRVVMDILGHAQISTTMDIYGHVLPSTQRAAAAKLDALLGDAVEERGATGAAEDDAGEQNGAADGGNKPQADAAEEGEKA